MKTRSMFVLLLLVALAPAVHAQYGIVCGNPHDQGCLPQYRGFGSHDLPFQTYRAELGTGTKHESSFFFAVILESVKAGSSRNRKGCQYISEAKRLAAQKLFPQNKVFASRNGCTDTVVLYENVNNEFNFMAAYGGDSEEEAGKILLKAQRRYPQANIRRMRVVLDFADE